VRDVLAFSEFYRQPEDPPSWDILFALGPADRKAREAIIVERGMRALREAARPAEEDPEAWNNLPF
jgi:hypothetical protein